MGYKFEMGNPACPVACKYCQVTELDVDRTANWTNGLLGINKACTFMNVPPWITEDRFTQQRFYKTPYHLLKGDFVGWTAVTDGFMPSLRPYFWHWVEQVSSTAKLLTVVTKWGINKGFMRELSRIPNLFLVITITGNRPPIELIPPEVHLRSLALAKEFGVQCLPMCHPYISGVSDLGFLDRLVDLGYSEVCFKGFRYNPGTMDKWVPAPSRKIYEGRGFDEVLPEDGWRSRVEDAGLSLLSPKQWYDRQGMHLSPKISLPESTLLVDQVLQMSTTQCSSDPVKVRERSILRRL